MTVRAGGAQFRMDDVRTSPFDMAHAVLNFIQTRITNERDKRDYGYQLPQPYNCRTRLFDAMLRGRLFIDAVQHPISLFEGDRSGCGRQRTNPAIGHRTVAFGGVGFAK